MPYEHRIEIKANYLYVKVTGNRERGNEVADSMNGWKMIAEKCQKENLHKVLTVLQLSGRLPVMSAYSIAGLASQLDSARKCKIALVDLNKDSLKDNQFGETVAINRGIRLKTFDNEEDAEKWLLNDF